MPGAIFLEGDGINLRTIEEEDLEFLKSVNLPKIRNNILSVSKPQNLENVEEFFQETVCDDRSVDLLICKEDVKMESYLFLKMMN